jgi:hypothetical protein
MTIGIAKANVAVRIPAVNSQGAKTSGTTNAYVNMGKLARNIRDARTTTNTFIMALVFHTLRQTR